LVKTSGKGTKEILVTIKQGIGSSKGDGHGATINGVGFSDTVTTSASKKMTVESKMNGVVQKITVEKSFRIKEGRQIELSGGWTFEEKEVIEGDMFHVITELSFHGKIMAAMYQPHPNSVREDDPNGYVKAPSGLYLRNNLREDEMVQILAICATMNDRLGIADLDTAGSRGIHT
jgi:hypothetical protein